MRARALIAAEPPVGDSPDQLAPALTRMCQAAVRVVPATGASVTLMSEDGVPRLVAASDEATTALDEIQLATGEGPGIEAAATARPVLVTDLRGPHAARWPIFAAAAESRGVRAVFGFPLQVGAVGLGAFDVYQDRSGPLTAEGLNWSLTFAEIAVGTLLDGQSAAPGEAPAAGLDEALRYRAELYQAQGMVMIQLGSNLTDALARMRAYAFAQDQPLAEVATAVVARRLTFSDDMHGRDEAGDALK